jgi:hypothetical protein
LWLAPVLAVYGEMLWQRTAWTATVAPLPDQAALLAGDSLAAVLTWIVRGEVLSMILAAAFLANSAGLRRGLWNGIASVFPATRWQRVIQLSLLASATAALGIPAVRFGAGGETGRLTVKLLAALWSSTAATLLMCRLMLAFEAACRVPAKSTKVRWAEVTGQYTARLWLPVLIGAVVFPVIDLASADMRALLRWYAWPAVALLAWFPFTALRAADAGEIHTVFRIALQRWAGGLMGFAGWFAVAGVQFFAFHLLCGWSISWLPRGTWWQAAAGVLCHGAWVWLAVWMLGAWIAIQVEHRGPSTQTARARRSGTTTRA